MKFTINVPATVHIPRQVRVALDGAFVGHLDAQTGKRLTGVLHSGEKSRELIDSARAGFKWFAQLSLTDNFDGKFTLSAVEINAHDGAPITINS